MQGNQGKYLLLLLLVDVTACAFSRCLGSGQYCCAWQMLASWLSCPCCLLFLCPVSAFSAVCIKKSQFVVGMHLLQGLYGCAADLLIVNVIVPSVCFSIKLLHLPMIIFNGIDWGGWNHVAYKLIYLLSVWHCILSCYWWQKWSINIHIWIFKVIFTLTVYANLVIVICWHYLGVFLMSHCKPGRGQYCVLV